MNRLAPMTIAQFLELIQDKQVICFGLGNQGRRVALYFQIWGLDDNLVAFADNDVSKAGKRFSFNGREIPIISPHEIVKYDSGNLFLLITSIHYQQIYEELDGLVKNSCVPVISLDEIADAELENTSYSEPMRESNNQAIPKIIHYSWFGEEKPISIKKNIAKCMWYEYISDDNSRKKSAYRETSGVWQDLLGSSRKYELDAKLNFICSKRISELLQS